MPAVGEIFPLLTAELVLVEDQRHDDRNGISIPFSVKLPLTPSDNKPGEVLGPLGKAAWGYAGLWREEAAAGSPVNRIPLFQLLLIPEGWCVWRVWFQMILADKC